MSYSNFNENIQKKALYNEFRQLFAGKEQIIDNIKQIDYKLTKLGISDKLLNKAKISYFTVIKKLRNQINDQDQLNIYILNILEENNRLGKIKPTEDDILNAISDVLEGEND